MEHLIYHEKYFCSPAAPWVIFIHGAGGNSSVWKKQVEEFGKHFNLLLVDLRGHGKSLNVQRKDEKAKYTWYEICGEVMEVLDSLKIEKANFVGISLGTIINRTIVEKYPNRVIALVQSGAITRFGLHSKIFSKTGNFLKEFIPGALLYKMFAYVAMPRRNHRLARSLFIRESAKISEPEFKRWAKLIADLPDFMKYFDGRLYDAPTFYLCGEQDYLFTDSIKKTVAKHANTSYYFIKDAGHVCNIEKADVFNEHAIKFLKKHN